MSGVIERVANAIADQMAIDDNDDMSLAIAAIKAMRDPTDEMIDAMKDNIGPLKAMWRGGIDAALQEPSQ